MQTVLCPEFLPAGHHKQVKGGFLPVAEKQVFTDHYVKHGVNDVAGFHMICPLMVGTLIRNSQLIQEVVSAYLARKPAIFIGRPSMIYFHDKSPEIRFVILQRAFLC